MMNLEKRQQFWIFAGLVALIGATHGHHFGTALHLPPAAWAVFFVLGFYVRSAWAFVALVAEIVAIDYFAITAGGVSAFCVSPAYGFLLPAYGTLWLAGRWFAGRYSLTVKALPALFASLVASFSLAELFTSGGFYFFSGRFAETTLAEFGSRLLKYAPGSLEAFVFWIGIAAIAHIALALATSGARKQA